MTRVGIGFKLISIMLITSALAGIVSRLFQGIFSIPFISADLLRICGCILLFLGIVNQIASGRVPATAFKKGELVTNGIFSFVRHPMYAGWIFLFSPGFALLFQSWLMLFTMLVGYVMFKFFIRAEDTYLTKKFGEEYLNYRSTVDELFPIKKITPH